MLAGVVDPLTLKVYGTNNVRVVDASLMPLQIAAHTQRTVYAIAERVSLVSGTHCRESSALIEMACLQASDIIRGRIRTS